MGVTETTIAVHLIAQAAVRLDRQEDRATSRAVHAERVSRYVQREASRADAALCRVIRAAGGRIIDHFYNPPLMFELADLPKGWKVTRVLTTTPPPALHIAG